MGGFGSMVLGLLAGDGMLDGGFAKVRTLALPDRFIDHDTPERMYADAGLDARAIQATVLRALGLERELRSLDRG